MEWQLVEPSILDLEHLYIQLGRAYEISDEWEKARAVYKSLLALAQKIGDEELREGFLSAPRVRCVLGRN